MRDKIKLAEDKKQSIRESSANEQVRKVIKMMQKIEPSFHSIHSRGT